ncbi:hypothetical protein FRC12_004091 [Ceratobasidium sp. 428]|nr:hypothetical protein FRC12_004091 [Ceratobasidium sp. 428]
MLVKYFEGRSLSGFELPPEILNIVVSLSSFETLAKIVCLNKWFHRSFGKLLYQDIHIHSASQLVELFQSTNIDRNLSTTWKLSVNRTALLAASWKEIPRQLEPAEYLALILQMTTSLRELVFQDLHPFAIFQIHDWNFQSLFRAEILKRALDPSFLPHLARIQSPELVSILPLCRGRPIEHLSHSLDSKSLMNLSATHFHPAGVSPTHLSATTSVQVKHGNFKPNSYHIAALLESAAREGLVIKHLRITVVGSELKPLDLPEADALAWITAISLEPGHEQLESLHIAFDPPPVGKSLEAQQQTLEQAIPYLPNLVYAVLGSPDVEWRNHVERQLDLAQDILDWTPCPNHCDLEVLAWWLRKLKLDTAKVVKENLEDTAVRMRDVMLTYWDHSSVPSIEELQAYLLALV